VVVIIAASSPAAVILVVLPEVSSTTEAVYDSPIPRSFCEAPPLAGVAACVNKARSSELAALALFSFFSRVISSLARSCFNVHDLDATYIVLGPR